MTSSKASEERSAGPDSCDIISQVGGFPLSPRGTSLGIGLQATPLSFLSTLPPSPPAASSLLVRSTASAPPTFICSRGGGARAPPSAGCLLCVVCAWSLSPAFSVSASSVSESSCRSQGLWACPSSEDGFPGNGTSAVTVVTACWLRNTISLRREVRLSSSSPVFSCCSSPRRPALPPEGDAPGQESGERSDLQGGGSWSLIRSKEKSDPARTAEGGGAG